MKGGVELFAPSIAAVVLVGIWAWIVGDEAVKAVAAISAVATLNVAKVIDHFWYER